MTFTDYQLKAGRTINPGLTLWEARRHAVYGLTAEAGEVAAIFQKMLQGHTFDERHLAKEIGDCLWMLAELCTVYRLDMDDVAQANIDKLLERYPNGFEVDKSVNRREGDD